MKGFEASHDRVLAAMAAVEAAERECLCAATGQACALAEEAGLGPGQLLVFHAVPRGDAVRCLDQQDCSLEDAVLQAVDLADVAGRRLRLTPAGLGPFLDGTPLPQPAGAFLRPCGRFLPGRDCRCGSKAAAEHWMPLLPPPPPRLGGRFWQRAVVTWVDLHRALATWTGRRLAATLVVAPETGDVGSLEPFYCPSGEPDFEVVTSLRLAAEPTSEDDLESALNTVLCEQEGINPDLIELDLRRWLHAAGFALPGFPAHPLGECDPPDDER